MQWMKTWKDSKEDDNFPGKKPDYMYDAWLLIEGTPRPEFDIKLFSETFPRWEELLREMYRGISQLSTPINK